MIQNIHVIVRTVSTKPRVLYCCHLSDDKVGQCFLVCVHSITWCEWIVFYLAMCVVEVWHVWCILDCCLCEHPNPTQINL